MIMTVSIIQLDQVENAYLTSFSFGILTVPFALTLHNVLTILNPLTDSFKNKSNIQKLL